MHKVLVVDDDKVLQQSVKQALEFHHFKVDSADNGKEAVQAVYREKYDLLLWMSICRRWMVLRL
jgi:two-component system response regulator HydG